MNARSSVSAAAVAAALTYALLGALVHSSAAAQSLAAAAPAPLPSLAELEAAGARIGQVRILALDIFDTTDPKEDKLLFRWANALHIQTRPGVIERALLFKTGDRLSLRVLEETERALRGNRFIYDVQFRAAAVNGGVVDIDVLTRDTWTLDLGASAGRTGGANTSGVHLKEYNLLGTGTAVSLGRSKSVDRSSNEFRFSNDRAFGTQTALTYSHASNSDGQRRAASAVHPFLSLDARWAAGASVSDDDRIDAVYRAGSVASQYRHHERQGEVFVGSSRGLVDGWAQRWTVGLKHQDDAYAVAPGLASTALLPASERLTGPFVRHALIEDRFEKVQNRNLVGRPEFFALGWASSVELGWAARGLGSHRGALWYAATASKGFEPAPGHALVTQASLSGQHADGQARRQQLGARLQHYRPQSARWLFYSSATVDALFRPSLADTLPLGGDNGLRGYPLRYQNGNRRALFTVEERFYTDLYLWQLFRIGGAAYADLGRAWGGEAANTVNGGWLGNVGVGLRIVSARAAFSNVLHVDLAFPMNAPADVKKMQVLVKTRASF